MWEEASSNAFEELNSNAKKNHVNYAFSFVRIYYCISSRCADWLFFDRKIFQRMRSHLSNGSLCSFCRMEKSSVPLFDFYLYLHQLSHFSRSDPNG